MSKIVTSFKLKRAACLIVFITSTLQTFSQDTVKPVYTRNIVWTTPVARSTNINGLAVGFMATAWMHADSLRIRGCNLEISPFGFFGGIYAIIGTIASPFTKDTVDAGDLGSNKVFTEEYKFSPTTIKGVSISFGGLSRDTKLSGLGINGVVGFSNQVNGFELTGLMNLHYKFRGVMIAGLRNKVTTGSGLQIGLINTCRNGKVVQLGLINRIGKRITPLVNFSFQEG